MSEETPQPALDAMSIASELIRARAERGFTQAHLAEVSGVSRSAIKAYETGRSVPGSRELRAICLALKVTPNKLIFGTEAPTLEDGPAAQLEAMLRSDPEGSAVTRARLMALSGLLTTDEAAALVLLAQSIATARHGAEKVRSHTDSAAAMVAFTRYMLDSMAKAERTGGGIKTDEATIEPYLLEFMERNGIPLERKPEGS